jgi:hypothetical protein
MADDNPENLDEIQEDTTSMEEKIEQVAKTTEKQLGGVTGKGFMPGESGNPNGRPPGSGISITTEIKKKLEECPEGQKATYLQLLINRILKQAIQEGDQQMIAKIWNYVDGMPRESVEVNGSFDLKTVIGNIELPPVYLEDFIKWRNDRRKRELEQPVTEIAGEISNGVDSPKPTEDGNGKAD